LLWKKENGLLSVLGMYKYTSTVYVDIIHNHSCKASVEMN